MLGNGRYSSGSQTDLGTAAAEAFARKTEILALLQVPQT